MFHTVLTIEVACTCPFCVTMKPFASRALYHGRRRLEDAWRAGSITPMTMGAKITGFGMCDMWPNRYNARVRNFKKISYFANGRGTLKTAITFTIVCFEAKVTLLI